jgi:glycosyltransferase 2 family protein
LRNKALAALLGVAVTTALLAWVLKDVSLAEVWLRARSAEPLYILGAVVLATSTFFLRIFRWRLILRTDRGDPIAVRPLWHAIAIGFMANNLLPFRAGEFIRAFTISRLAPVRVTSALSSLLLERLFDGVTTIALLFVGLLSAGLPPDAEIAGFRLSALATRTAILLGVLLACCVAALLFPALAKRIVHRVVPSARIADKIGGAIDGLREGLSSLSSPGRIVGSALWSIVIWVVNGASFWCGFQAFGIDVGFGGALLLQTFLLIGIAAPSTPGYFGPFEAAIKAVLSLFGVDPNVAVSFGLTYHFTTFIPITLLGLWSLTTTGLSLKDVKPAAAAGTP